MRMMHSFFLAVRQFLQRNSNKMRQGFIFYLLLMTFLKRDLNFFFRKEIWTISSVEDHDIDRFLRFNCIQISYLEID